MKRGKRCISWHIVLFFHLLFITEYHREYHKKHWCTLYNTEREYIDTLWDLYYLCIQWPIYPPLTHWCLANAHWLYGILTENIFDFIQMLEFMFIPMCSVGTTSALIQVTPSGVYRLQCIKIKHLPTQCHLGLRSNRSGDNQVKIKMTEIDKMTNF